MTTLEDLIQVLSLLEIQLTRILHLQEIPKAHNGIERRAQFVAHVRQKL